MEKLLERIKEIHFGCHKLCMSALGKYLPVSGNIGVFCQSGQEYEEFTKLREQITFFSDNQNQKYFKLIKPIVIAEENGIPQTTYTHLYIRQFDPTPYGKYLGDVDFILPEDEYKTLKEEVSKNNVKNAMMYNRPGWDTVQITDPNINAAAYVSTQEFAEKVRVKFD